MQREREKCLGGLVAKRREESGGDGGGGRIRSKFDEMMSPETLLTAAVIAPKCNRR